MNVPAGIWPKLFPFLQWWPMVTTRTLKSDVLAAMTGAIIVLPQGVAFAMIAGLPPIYGLYTAMIPPIIAALFGSSWHLISGPTTTISLIVFATLSVLAEPGTMEYVNLAIVLAFIAGSFRLLMGLARFGTLVNFVSSSVVVGFTAGAALLIGISQLKHVLGLKMPNGLAFHDTVGYIITHFTLINPWILLVAGLTMVIALVLKRWVKKVPPFLTGMVVASVVTYFLGAADKGIPLVGQMPAHLPPFRVPDLTLANITKLGSSGFAIALLGLIEATAIGRSIALRSQQRLDSNQEFIGQGLAYIVGSFFSCYPGSGSFTRSGVNFDAGAKTPLAAVFASLMLILIVLFIAPLSAYLPIAAMGGVILIVAYNLINFQEIKKVIRASGSEATVLIATFLATLFFELEFAIYIGIFLSLFFYLRRTSKPHIAIMAPDQKDVRHHFLNTERQDHIAQCPQLKVVRIDGSLFYGAIDHIEGFFEALRDEGTHRVLLLADGINFVDLAGAEWLLHESERLRSRGGDLYITGMKIVAQDILFRSGIKEQIGTDHFFSTKKQALAAIYPLLDPARCEQCTARIFWECQQDDRLPVVEQPNEMIARD
ncbi:MAG: SulP family inorganic anion transporter [Lewinellaceae bacterium]|nr:SulP family inorganic anion transporter [Lewinellaceae bacterium]